MWKRWIKNSVMSCHVMSYIGDFGDDDDDDADDDDAGDDVFLPGPWRWYCPEHSLVLLCQVWCVPVGGLSPQRPQFVPLSFSKQTSTEAVERIEVALSPSSSSH
jgi:hypothetical protein